MPSHSAGARPISGSLVYREALLLIMSKSPEKSATPPLTAAEFNDYIIFHAHKLTPHDLRVLSDRLPKVRESFSQVKTSNFPHTPERLHFLADVVEAFIRGRVDEVPFECVAEAGFALIYLDQQVDLIPDDVPEIGFIDDVTITALVLERNAPAFRSIAQKLGKDWAALKVAERGGF